MGARFAVFHSDGLDIFHFPGGPAFHAISIHQLASCVNTYNRDTCLKLIKNDFPRAPVSLHIRPRPGRDENNPLTGVADIPTLTIIRYI
jgi:hypothetical protein